MWLVDKLANVVSGLGTAKDKAFHDRHVFTGLTRAEIDAAYRGDWVARKAIDIPPHDEVKNGRDWQAEGDQIELLEAEEKRLGYWPKLLRARKLARLYGGSVIVLGTNDPDPSQELRIDVIQKGGLTYLHVLNRFEISAGEVNRDVMSLFYGQPLYWEVKGANGTQARLHPSRVVRFIGNELPDTETSVEPWFGDSVLESIMEAVRHVGLASQGVAALLHEAKVDIIKVPNLMESLASADYQSTLITRFTLANQMKSMVNAVLLDAEEEWDQKQVSFATLPDIMDRYMQAVSGAADIPTTRMLGQAPQGMNSTGDGDYKNYLDRIAAGQELELRPALEPLDECLIRSALGARPDDIHYTWAPLWQMSEKEKAEIAKSKAETTEIYANGALVPIDALAKAAVNQLVEDGTYPGLEAAIDESELEVGEVDPDALQPGGNGEEGAADPQGNGQPTANRTDPRAAS